MAPLLLGVVPFPSLTAHTMHRTSVGMASSALVTQATQAGSVGHVGVLEVETKEHGYRTVCGIADGEFVP